MSPENEIFLRGFVLGASVAIGLWAIVTWWYRRLAIRSEAEMDGFMGGKIDILSAYPSPAPPAPVSVCCPVCQLSSAIQFKQGTMLCGNCLHVFKP